MVPAETAVLRHRAAVEDLKIDAGIAHPAHGRIGLADQKLGKFRHRAAARDAHQIGIEVIGRVRKQIDLVELGVAHLRQ